MKLSWMRFFALPYVLMKYNFSSKCISYFFACIELCLRGADKTTLQNFGNGSGLTIANNVQPSMSPHASAVKRKTML